MALKRGSLNSPLNKKRLDELLGLRGNVDLIFVQEQVLFLKKKTYFTGYFSLFQLKIKSFTKFLAGICRDRTSCGTNYTFHISKN